MFEGNGTCKIVKEGSTHRNYLAAMHDASCLVFLAVPCISWCGVFPDMEDLLSLAARPVS